MASTESFSSNQSEEKKCKLIINYLPQKMTDKELLELFSPIGAIESCKIMRDQRSNYSFGYGFVTYKIAEDAEQAIQVLNGFNIGDKKIKVSYSRPPGEEIKDTNLYVQNLPKTFTEDDLVELFSSYGNIVQKSILKDKITGMPRGVGFVRFSKKEEAQEAINGVSGQMLDGCVIPVYVKLAEEHGKQKAAYFAGLQTGIAIRNNRGGGPGGRGGPQRGGMGGRGVWMGSRFNPMGRGYHNNF